MFTILFSVVAISSIIFLVFAQSADRRSIFDPGVLTIGIFSYCYLAPTILAFTASDTLLDDDIKSIETLSLYGFLFTMTFFVCYTNVDRLFSTKSITNATPAKAIAPSLCFFITVSCIGIHKFIMNSYGVGDSSEYSEQYIIRAEMPLLIAQGLNVLGKLILLSQITLLCSIYSSARGNNISMKFVYIVGAILFVDMMLTQSRSNFVTYAMISIGAYGFYEARSRLGREIVFSMLFVFSMSLFAVIRASAYGGQYFSLLDFLMPSEFTAIYNNAIHLIYLNSTTDYIAPPGNSYWQALVAFIPQQFNEGKWDLSSWYVSEYFPEYQRAGGGLAFGVIPEAVVNFGIPSIIFQAFIIGVILKLSHRFAVAGRVGGVNVLVVFYIYCFALLYQTIRSESFVILGSLVTGFVIPYVLLQTLFVVFGRGRESTRIGN